ncbi:hypothetical protein pb186bvf_018028, partial [Paramecium bursaria]
MNLTYQLNVKIVKNALNHQLYNLTYTVIKISIKNITNCSIDNIQQCLEDFFNQEMIDYMKKQVIKELEINLNIQDQLCYYKQLNVTQFMSRQVLSLKKTTLKLSSQNQSRFLYLILTNFSNYFISNLTSPSNIQIFGQKQNITLEQIIITNKEFFSSQFENVLIFVLKDVIIKDLEYNGLDLFRIYNSDFRYNITVSITGLQILNSIFERSNRYIFNILFLNGGQIDLILTNITIVKSKFKYGFSFVVSNGQQIKAIIKNLIIENNIFKDCQFIKFENLQEQSQFQVTVKNNTLNNSILIQIPILSLKNSIFRENKLYNSSIFIKSIGSFDKFSGQFNFIQLLTQKNEYCYGCQFISINQQDYQNISVYFENYSSINNQEKDFLNIKLNYEKSLIFIQSNYVFLNQFTIERLNGTIQLSIMQTQQIIIKNLTIQNNYIHKIITKQSSCLPESQNLVIYIFDTKYILVDTFIINQLSAIDQSIIIIQSQSILKKEQNETIILKNGQIINNSLVVSQLIKQISVIQINSQQLQQIHINYLNFEKNILNLYVKDSQMLSASTLLIQSDRGLVYLQSLNFQKNFVFNSSNSQLFIQCNFMQIRDTIFLNNNNFDLEVLKNFLILDYYDRRFIELIYLFDFPIQSNGGSGQFIASKIIIENINIQGSFGANGGAFYIQTIGESTIKISDSLIFIHKPQIMQNPKEGHSILMDQNLIYNQYQKIFRFNTQNLTLQLTSQINNISCTNCFSNNGGFIIVDSTVDYYPTYIILKNINIQNPDLRWFLGNVFDMKIEEQIIFRKNSYLLYLPNSIIEMYQLQIADGDFAGILYIDGKNGIFLNQMIIQQYRAFIIPLITISHSQSTKKQIYLANIQIKDINQGKFNQYICNYGLMEKNFETFDTNHDCSKGNSIKNQEILTFFDDHFIDNNFYCNYQNIHQTSEQQTAMIEVFNLTSNLITIENIYINNVTYQAEYGLFSLRDFSQIVNQIKINNLNIINSYCGNGCMLVSSSTQNLINKKRLLVNNMQIIKQSNSSFIINNSKFLNNEAIQGSGIYSINQKFLGGAIYFNGNINNLLLLNNEIISNKAVNVSGSGIYLKDITMSKLNGLQNIFIDNQYDLNEIPQG